MAKANIYLTFNGNCEQAFDFYKSVFGGELLGLMRFKDMPDADFPIPAELREKVMHTALPLTDGLMLFGSDNFDSACGGTPLTVGNNVAICLNTESEEESRRLFDALADGGTVIMPLEPTFWAPLYGLLCDRFGIEWMINYEPQRA